MTQTRHLTRPMRSTLQLEGAAIAALCIWLYGQTAAGWLLFAALLLAPDLFMLGYLAGTRVGALCYNFAHSYTVPVLLAGVGMISGSQAAVAVALIWGAHIGLDRAIGYGLKYGDSFKSTHLSGA